MSSANWVITKITENVVFKKITGDNAKKTKRLTGIHVVTKDFKSYKMGMQVFKKVTQSVKIINYWELVKPINQSAKSETFSFDQTF